MKIGYDYGRLVTGEKLEIEFDLEEEAVFTGGDQEVPDPLEEESMVATSAEVHTCFICFSIIVYFMDISLFCCSQVFILCGFRL